MTLNLKPTLLTAAILCSICFLLGKCTGSEPDLQLDKQGIIDSLNRDNTLLENEKICLKSNLDSVATQLDNHDSIRTIYRTRYQTIREIVPADSAQCFELLARTRLSCDSALSAADSVISDYEAKDSLQGQIIMVQEKQIAERDTAIQKLAKTVTDQEKKLETANKKVRRNRLIAGISSVVAAIAAIL